MEEQLRNIWDYRTHTAFSNAERAALDLALAASVAPNDVDMELKARVQSYWNDGEIVEILSVISLFGYLNLWNDTMATTIEEGAESAASFWLAASVWREGKHI